MWKTTGLMHLSYEQLIFRNFFQSDTMEQKLTVVFARLESACMYFFLLDIAKVCKWSDWRSPRVYEHPAGKLASHSIIV